VQGNQDPNEEGAAKDTQLFHFRNVRLEKVSAIRPEGAYVQVGWLLVKHGASSRLLSTSAGCAAVHRLCTPHSKR
jgi:hypothetical protein